MDFDTARLDRSHETKLERLLKEDHFARVNEAQIKPVVMIQNLSDYFYNLMAAKLESATGKSFLYFKTDSKLLYEYINRVSKHTGITPIALKEKNLKNGEVSAVFYENGEKVKLYTEKGDPVCEDQFYMLLLLILKRKGEANTLVLPPYVSQKVIAFAEELSLRVKLARNSQAGFMKELIKEGLTEQFSLLYDGVYAALKVCEYCAFHQVTLAALIEAFPKVYKTTAQVALEGDKRGEIMGKLSSHYSTQEMEYDGLKIEEEKGWAFILPDNAKFSFTIITEGLDEEYSKELCEFYGEEIKKMKI